MNGMKKIAKAELFSSQADCTINQLDRKLAHVRFVHDIEKLAVASVAEVLRLSGIEYPVGDSSVALYIGVDNCIEKIKNEYLAPVLQEGLVGASPLIFPYTSPNVLAAKIAIVFDLRGENMTFSIQKSGRNMIDYFAELFSTCSSPMAITGKIMLDSPGIKDKYWAEFMLWRKTSD